MRVHCIITDCLLSRSLTYVELFVVLCEFFTRQFVRHSSAFDSIGIKLLCKHARIIGSMANYMRGHALRLLRGCAVYASVGMAAVGMPFSAVAAETGKSSHPSTPQEPRMGSAVDTGLQKEAAALDAFYASTPVPAVRISCCSGRRHSYNSVFHAVVHAACRACQKTVKECVNLLRNARGRDVPLQL